MNGIDDVVNLVEFELTKLDQRYAGGDPEISRPLGDCYRTSLACLFGLTYPGLVPNFVDLVEDEPGDIPAGWKTIRMARKWARDTFGCDIFTVQLDAAIDSGVHYLASVNSKSGDWRHVVICKGREVIHDTAAHQWPHREPYVFQDVLDGVEGVYDTTEVLVEPYNPAPDAQLVYWTLNDRELQLDGDTV